MAALADIAKRLSPERKGALVITGATLIDGTGGAPLADAVVVIEGDRITAVGPRDKIPIPKGATVVDARGKFLLPGLWDMHAHFEQVEWGPTYLAAGVTTVRDVGNEFEFITAVRDAIKEGRGLGPRLLLAGIVDGDSPTAWGLIRANTPEEARAVVNRYHAAGFQQIKIYSSVKPRNRQGHLRRGAQARHDGHGSHSQRHECDSGCRSRHGSDQSHSIHPGSDAAERFPRPGGPATAAHRFSISGSTTGAAVLQEHTTR